ncbi:MAG: SpoIIE family protein phosphatase [Planctomycetota bacterium]|jgi:serine phosphatase RsbU (regulator of sigma subunit)|nr:SpoIIE family protein phosphatase [Planctomycetota bacterium]
MAGKRPRPRRPAGRKRAGNDAPADRGAHATGPRNVARSAGSSSVRIVPQDEAPVSRIQKSVENAGEAGSVGRRGSRFKPGTSLAVKFALVISLVAAFLVATSGFTILSMAQGTLIQEIDRKGFGISRIASALCEEYYENLLAAKTDYENGITDSEDAQQRNQVKKIHRGKLQRIHDQYRSRLQNIVLLDPTRNIRSEDLLNIILQPTAGIEKDFFPPVQATNITSGSWDETPYETEIDGTTYKTDVKLLVGQVRSSSGTIAIRGYKRKLNPTPYSVLIFLTAEKIGQVKSELFTITILTTLVSVLLGILVSFFLASRITKPVRSLVQDIEVVASGDLEHRTIVHSKDEIGVLASTFDSMTQSLLIAHEADLEHKGREHELNIATEIQSNLLPRKIPQIEGYEIDAFYQPSKEVGGDYYDFIQIDEDHTGFIVADVSGKGIPGSLVMTMARSLIRVEAQRNLSPADTFIKANRIIAKDIKRGMFVTALYVVLNHKTGALKVASAGHNPMVVFRSQVGKVSLVNPNGIALGFDKGPIFERTIKEETIRLEPGDRVVIYTDGVPEAMNPPQEEFGEKRFYKMCQSHGAKSSNQLVNILVTTLESWRDNSPQSDDITISTIKRL